MRHCTFCGTELPEQARFCGYCGRLSTISGEWPQERVVASSTWPSQDEPTIISNTSLPTIINEQTVLHSQQEEPTLLTPPNTAIWMPPVLQQSNEEEQDRARRAMVWGIPLSGAGVQGPSGAPVVQGTPQVNVAPSLPVTPQLQMAGQSRYTPPPYPQSFHRTQFEQQKKRAVSSAGTSAARNVALQWMIVVVTAVIVLTTAGVGVALAVSPTLSLPGGLGGNRVIAPGQYVSLHGSGFLPGGHVTLKRDNNQNVQIATQNMPSAGGSVSSLDVAHMIAENAMSLAALAGSPVTVNAAGTFDVSLIIGKDWGGGDHIIRATEDIFSRNATMTVTVDDAPPALSVAPTSLNFGSVQKGTKTSLSLAIGNSGGKPLAWTADSGGTKWLKLQSTSGDVLPDGVPQSLTVSCDTTSLAPGTYSSVIQVHTDGGNTDVKVSLQVVAQKLARLSASTTTLDFQTMYVGQQATKVISISNTGTLKLDWQVTSNQDWVSLDPTSGSILPGGAPQGVNVQIDTTGLQPGSYSATLTIGSNGGTAQITVFLVVPAPPTPTPTATPVIPTVTPTVSPTVATQGRICDLPPTLDFGTLQQGKTATLPLTLGNCGGTSFTWTARSGDVWITINKSGGTLDPHNATVTINVTVDTTSFKSTGRNQGSVVFYTSVGDQTVNITVTVAQPVTTPTLRQTITR